MTTPTFQQLLGHLHRGGAWAYWWTADASGDGRPRSHWWPVDRPPLPLPDDEQRNVYFGVHPCRVRRRDRQRATIATIAAINCLYAEFDAAPGAKPALLEQLRALAPAPSVIIDSGGGYHLYWLLDQPFALADDAARERARAAQYAWVGYTGGDPAARDLARVLRVPGTINYKPSYAPDYPTVAIVAADLRRTYALEALEEAAAAFLRPAEPALHAFSQPVSFADLDDLARAARALERLGSSRCDNYDDWLHVGMALHAGLGESGLRLWESWSRRSAKYAEGVCARKWRSFDAARHGYTLASLFYWADQDSPAPHSDAAHQATRPARQRAGDAHTSGRCRKPLLHGGVADGAEGLSPAARAASPEPEDTADTGDEADDPLVQALQLTDLGNAHRLVAQHGHELRYVQEWGWMVWDGRRWDLDRTGAVMRRAKATALAIAAEAETAPDDKAVAKILAWARASQSRGRLEAMIALAMSEPGIATRTECFDTHDWLLNCRNGTLDLRSGALRPHRHEDLLTRLVDVDYDPQAQCPTWETFLDRIMAGNRGLTGYLQRAVGYALTGDTGEQAMFLLYGTGANGKSTFLEVIRTIAGDYGRQTDPTTFLARQGGDRIPNDIARLAGARFVSAIEVEEGRRLSEVLIKQVVSGDTLTARFLNREFFEFRARFKLFLAANHRPVVRGTDEGIWRRLRLIPFTVTIPKPERDRTLLSRLVQELPGILAWAVRGCLAFNQGGLADPPEVLAATESYRSEMDIVGGFIADRCVIAGHARAECGALYAAYTGWCEENGEHAVSQRRFGQQLEERGFGRRRSAQGKWCRSGIGLLDEHDHSDPGAPPAPDDPPPGAPGAPGAQAQSGATPPAPEQQVIQVTQGDPTFGVAAESQPAPAPITPPRVDWAYVQRLLSIGDERAVAAINVHCELTGVAVEDVLAAVRRRLGSSTTATTRAPPPGRTP